MLKFENAVESLSPTALMTSITSPYTYWFQKLSKDYSWDREPTGLAAGVGTWFDVLVKEALIAKGVESSLSMDEIIASLDAPDDIVEEIKSIGQSIFNEYRKAGFLRDTPFMRVEIHKKTPYRGIRLSGQLDATVNIDDVECVLDFKVSGANSTAGVSPKPGYESIYRTDIVFGEPSSRKTKTGWDGAHKNYTPNMPFDEIDEKWALQMCFYSWILYPQLAGEKEFPIVIHSPIFNGKSKQLCFVVYKGVLTIEFQNRVLNHIDSFIDKVISGDWIQSVNNKEVLKHNPMVEIEIAHSLARMESWMTKLVV